MKTVLLAMHTTLVAGAERVVGDIRSHIENLRDTGLTVQLAALRDTEQKDPRRALGVKAILFGKFDLIHSHLFVPGLAVRVRRLFDRSFTWVHTVHYVNYEGQSWPRLKRFLDHRFIFPSADRLVAVSESVFNSLTHFSNKSLIENQIVLRRDDESAVTRSAMVGEEMVVGTLSMLRPEKGLGDLIEAHRLIIARGERVRLKIAGDGPERAKLEQLVRQLGLEHSVEFVGYLKDTSQFFRSLDLFVNASKTESFGLAMLEAFQFSLPVIAARVGHSADLLRQGRFGLLVDRGEGFAARLADQIRTARERLPELRERASDGFNFYSLQMNPEAMPKAHVKLYHGLLRPGVCMISPVVTQATGGIQRQILLQSRELDRRGYRVFVLQRRDRNLKSYLALDEARWRHVTFLSTPDFGTNDFNDSPLKMKLRGVTFIAFGLLAIARRRHQIQILHAHQLYSPSLIAFFAKKFFGMVTVVKVTASGAFGEYQQLQKLPFFRFRKWTFQSLDRVVVLTEDMQSEVRKLGLRQAQIALVPNSVETQPDTRPYTQAAAPAETTLPKRERLEVLYCGRLSKEKSLETLVSALALLAKEGVSSRLRLVGGDHGGRTDGAHLRTLCEALPETVQIEFLGHQENVRPFYLSSDVFVLPSLSEGMSNSLLEAMAYGLVCVVSDIPANTFVIQDGFNGLNFHCGDAAHLKDRLGVIVKDLGGSGQLSATLSKNARQTIVDRFSVQSVGARLSEIYTSHLPKDRSVKQVSL